MRITLSQKIAGYPAGQIRQLMRETVGRSITLRYVREILQCSDSAAIQVLNRLQEQGFVEPIQDHLEPSTKGSALAMATAAAPLRRETAERLIEDVIERARSINEDDKWSYRIGKLVVFGSFLRGAEHLNDVDIACELLPRWTGERQAQEEQGQKGSETAIFPQYERVGGVAEVGGDLLFEVARARTRNSGNTGVDP